MLADAGGKIPLPWAARERGAFGLGDGNGNGHARASPASIPAAARGAGRRRVWGVLRVDHEDRSAAGRLPDAMEPDIHCVTTHWIQGFMAFRLVRRTRIAMLMVPV